MTTVESCAALDLGSGFLDPGTDALHVPNLLAGRLLPGQRRMLASGRGPTVSVAVGSELVQQRMLERCAEAGAELRAIDAAAWAGLTGAAADLIESWLQSGRVGPHCAAVAETGGLPPRRVARGLAGVARLIRRLPEVMAAQSPDGQLQSYRDGRSGRTWAWLPAGRTCVVRVPDNFPTIAVEWLQVLAARRPVVINTADGDPVITVLVALALLQAGLPPGSLSVYHGAAPRLWAGTDQLIWPGEQPPEIAPAGATKTYHFGRSKVVLADPEPADDVLHRLTRLAFEGSGRLCTNVSAVAVLGGAAAATRTAERLGRHFARIEIRPLDDPAARVAAWPDEARAEVVAAMIRREVAAGARDVSSEVSGSPLVQTVGGRRFLRPTVLAVDPDSPLFRVELPFPFVTVAATDRQRVVRDCRESLIVGVVGEPDATLLPELLAEPTIGKVFAGDHFDRGYDPVDPQEGYLADFLFQKKAVHGWPT